MHCYTFHDVYRPGSLIAGNMCTAFATKIPNKIRVTIRLSQEPVKTSYVKSTRYKGEKLFGIGAWRLSDFIEERTEAPTVLTRFDDLNGGQKIPCIKAVRAVTGYGLKEAKEFVEAMGTLNAIIEIVDFCEHPKD